jgi:hypothetical protein
MPLGAVHFMQRLDKLLRFQQNVSEFAASSLFMSLFEE